MFVWERYLDLAKELSGQTENDGRELNRVPIQEAKLRSAISRSYYAAFCKARNYLRDIEGDKNIPKTGAAHRHVRKKFMESNDRTRKTIGESLTRLIDSRRKADYEDVFSGLNPTAKAALILSETIINNLNNLLNIKASTNNEETR